MKFLNVSSCHHVRPRLPLPPVMEVIVTCSHTKGTHPHIPHVITVTVTTGTSTVSDTDSGDDVRLS